MLENNLPMKTMLENLVINPPKFDALAAYGIGGLAIIMALLCSIIGSAGNKRRALGLAIGFLVLLGSSGLAATSGLLARFDLAPPPMLIMFAAMLVIALTVGLSRFGRVLATETPLIWLIGLQCFRLPLELIMHHAASEAIMPVQLSFSGYNFDIVTGIGAVALSILLWLKFRVADKVIWLWNIWGLLCLLVIVIIAVATSPLARAFGSAQVNLNTWVLFFPYVWLPVVLVLIAISGHIIITRKLLQRAT